MAGRAFGGLGGYGGMTQFTGMRKRPWLGGDLMGQDRGEIRQPADPYSGQGGFMQGMLSEMGVYRPTEIGGRNPLPGWPGDAPVSTGEDYGALQYGRNSVRGFDELSKGQSTQGLPYWLRRMQLTTPEVYGVNRSGRGFPGQERLGQVNESLKQVRGGRYGPAPLGGGSGFAEGYQGDALRRLLQARLGGGGL